MIQRQPTVAAVLAVALTVSMFATPALAVQSSDWGDEFYEEMKPLVEKYNANLDQVPGLIKDQLGGEQVEVVVTNSDGEEAVYSVELANDGRIKSFENAPADKPTMRVTTTEDAINEIKNAEDKQWTFWKVYDRGDFRIKGITFGNNVKVTVGKILVEIFQFLGLV